MKMIKTILWLFLSMVALAVLAGCGDYNGPYPFRQDLGNVTRVEIYQYNHALQEQKLIAQLSDSDLQQFLSELDDLHVGTYGMGDHPRSYGLLIICLVYADGEIEKIGLTNIGYITSDGREELTHYLYDAKELFDLLAKYVDSEILSDLRDEYPGAFP